MCINYRKYNGVLRPCIVWTLYLWVGKASLRMWNLSPNLRDYSRCEPGHQGGIGRVSVCVWGAGMLCSWGRCRWVTGVISGRESLLQYQTRGTERNAEWRQWRVGEKK